MIGSLITQTNNLSRIEEPGNNCVRGNPLLNSPPIEGEYLPPEHVDTTKKPLPDINFQLFVEIHINYGPLIDHKKHELNNAADTFFAYQALEKFVKEENLKGQCINIIV